MGTTDDHADRSPMPPGWHPDPAGGGLRFWDGQGWTRYTYITPTPDLTGSASARRRRRRRWGLGSLAVAAALTAALLARPTGNSTGQHNYVLQPVPRAVSDGSLASGAMAPTSVRASRSQSGKLSSTKPGGSSTLSSSSGNRGDVSNPSVSASQSISGSGGSLTGSDGTAQSIASPGAGNASSTTTSQPNQGTGNSATTSQPSSAAATTTTTSQSRNFDGRRTFPRRFVDDDHDLTTARYVDDGHNFTARTLDHHTLAERDDDHDPSGDDWWIRLRQHCWRPQLRGLDMDQQRDDHQ